MKLFGSKDQDDNQPEAEEVHDDGFDAVEDATDDIEGGDGTAPVALSAPARSAGGGGSSKKGLLAVVGLVVVAGLGGGYYYLTNMAGDDALAPVKSAQKAAPVKAAAIPPQPTPAPSASTATVAPAATAAAPAADPLALPPEAAMAVPPAPAAGATAPTATPAAAGAASPVTAGAAATAAAGATAPVATGAAPVTGAPTETPPQDLPVPSAAMMAAGPDTSSGSTAAAPTWAQPGAEVPVTKDEAARKAANAVAGTKPSDAEMAIVQNAAVLDQLSQPAATPDAATAKPDGAKPAAAAADKTAAAATPPKLDKSAMKTVDQLLQQDAVIRPLPNGYVTIIKNHDAGDLDSRLTRARVALSDNNNSAALELFNELNKDYPKDTRVLMGRAVALQKMGQVDDALAAYEAVLNADPKNLEALTNMLGLLKTKDPQLALEKLQDLRAAYPYQPDITAQLGVAYAQAGDYDNALKYLNMAQALAPENAYVLYNQAVLYDKMGRSQKAGDLYRQIVRLAAEGSITDPLPIDQIKQRLIDLR